MIETLINRFVELAFMSYIYTIYVLIGLGFGCLWTALFWKGEKDGNE